MIKKKIAHKTGDSFLIKKKRTSKKSEHYVNKEHLFTELVKFHTECQAAGVLDVKMKDWGRLGLTRPAISGYIGEAIYKISNKLSTSMSFRNYPFREDLVSDGVENCIKYITNFDPDVSNNPFGYFSQICYFAFLRRIKTEKKALYTKFKVIQNSEIFGLLCEEDQNYVAQLDIGYSEAARANMDRMVKDYEDKL